MSPRRRHMPLSGSLRKAQRKGFDEAEGVIRRETARLKQLERDTAFAECQRWNAQMWVGETAQPSPTIAQAVLVGFNFLDVRCHRCDHAGKLDLRKLRRKPDTHLHVIEAALFCEACSKGKKWKQRAYARGLTHE